VNGAARWVAAAGALIGAYGLYLQYVLLYTDMTAQGATAMEATWRYFAYFTILTNCFVTLVMARAAFSPLRLTGLNAPRVELMAVTSILFVGIVYNMLLASRWNPQGWQKLADVIVHDAMPVLFALFWLLRPHGALTRRDAAFAAIWPFAYAAYGLARGALDHFYPYFFMDPSTTPWPQVLLNMTGLVIAFMLGASVLVAASRAFSRRAPS
jgi:hypothetical protein